MAFWKAKCFVSVILRLHTLGRDGLTPRSQAHSGVWSPALWGYSCGELPCGCSALVVRHALCGVVLL